MCDSVKLAKSILVTGVAGSGKSTVCEELRKRGYTAYNLDEVPSLLAFVHKKTGKVIRAWDNKDLEMVKQMNWICDKRRLTRLIRKNNRGDAFYCGSASNIDDLLPLFDRVLLLKPSKKTLSRRLATRTTNDFAKVPKVRHWYLRTRGNWENRLCRKGAIVIDGDMTIRETVDVVLRKAQ